MNTLALLATILIAWGSWKTTKSVWKTAIVFIIVMYISVLLGVIVAIIFDMTSKKSTTGAEPKNYNEARYAALRDRIRADGIPTKDELKSKKFKDIPLTESDELASRVRETMSTLYSVTKDDARFNAAEEDVKRLVEEYENKYCFEKVVTIASSTPQNTTEPVLEMPVIEKAPEVINDTSSQIETVAEQPKEFKFCRFCGAKVEAYSKFCHICGKQL